MDFGNNDIRVYPFIVDKITDKRDSHFAVYKQIEANGLAFAELGKVGYKLELNSHTLETDYANDKTIVATINYWLDKVFPNEKDDNGKVIKWLTPWCYEIRMDWSYYTAAGRELTKVYEESYVNSWGIENGKADENGIITEGKLVSRGITTGLEKARYIDCEKSNKYNITQDIAEAFEVFCQYEYKCAPNGKFIHEYTDENGNLWRGRKVIFYNRAIKTENPFIINYEDNLNSISRVKDSSELYTKLFITPIESETMESGYISIADTTVNPLLDDFILNFDYLYETGSISDYQMNYINTYEISLYSINNQLINLAPVVEGLTIEVNNAEANVSSAEKEISSAQEALQTYQKLRDNEATNTPVVKNKDNAYSVIFVKNEDISKAQIRLQGVVASSIVGYPDYNYNTPIFSASSLIVTTKLNKLAEGDTNVYLVLDDYGYPSYLYTRADNSNILDENGSAIIYLALTYSPKNAYESICQQLLDTIDNRTNQRDILKEQVDVLQKELDDAIAEQERILALKDELNQKLELVLGPALREGYWTPDSYEDPGEGVKEILEISQASEWNQSGPVLVFDNEPFDGEETGYYYDSIESLTNEEPIYYDYIDISELYEGWHEEGAKIEDLVIHLLNPNFKYAVAETEIAAGSYFVIYNGEKWYYTLSNTYGNGAVLEIKIVDEIPTLYISDGTVISMSQAAIDGATNQTPLFEGINSYLGDRLLYNDAGFVFAFITVDEENVKPVLLLNNTSIDYNRYQNLSYSFSGSPLKGNIDNSYKITNTEYEVRYPRVIIYSANVNYDSDLLTIIPLTSENEEELTALTKYYDYTILLRNGKPHFTFKITNENDIYTILNRQYRINYQVSRANEMLYLDAKTVAYDNSRPKYSYELTVANTPDKVQYLELGELCYINDHSLGIRAASGYISSIKYKLDKPQDDTLTIKNYKTKFEDLFSTITASSEAMRNNQIAYDIAAGGFNADGTIDGSVLQNSITNNNIAINYSATNVSIDDVNGITLTNAQPYLNGVYGQVMLQGGGIFLSNAIDASGARIWNTGITPTGINASMINAGQLDTNLIRIFAGNNVAFQWNGEGIFAYKQNEGSVDLTSYVRYSDKGLQFVSGDFTAVDLGWNGLLISTQNGSTELTGEYGLTIYDGVKRYKEDNPDYAYNHVVRLGGFEDDEYGLRLYKNDGNDNYIENLVMTNSGELWLKDELVVGSYDTNEDGTENIAGLSGETIEGDEVLNGGDADMEVDDSEVAAETLIGGFAGVSGDFNAETYGRSIRFWAGRAPEYKQVAPFRVLQDGTLYAEKAIIKGDIHATSGYFSGELAATTGIIGGWKIGPNSLSSADGLTNLYSSGNQRINVNNKFTVDANGTMYANGATISGTIEATGGKIGNLTINQVETGINNIDSVTENMNTISVEITSSNGNITKTGEEFTTTLVATIKRGGINVVESEYENYTYDWQCSDDGENWYALPDSTGERTVQYSEEHNSNRYIICYVNEKEVSDGGDTITE